MEIFGKYIRTGCGWLNWSGMANWPGLTIRVSQVDYAQE